jgi:serine/threonine-protein kinase SRPK3
MTDLKLSNIMLRIEDQSIFADYEKAEDRSPSDRKPINFRRPQANAYGLPVLCDFGEARIGVPQPYTEIQPEIYKAPEILMQFEWSHSADIWNAACLV